MELYTDHPTFLQQGRSDGVGGRDSLVTETGTQTLTNKTLTSPTITGAALTNPTISGRTPVDITTASVTLGPTHVGRPVTLNAGTGIDITLPAATGSGDQYTLFIRTTFASGTARIVRAGSDTIMGTATLYQDGGDTVVGFNATAATTITLFVASNTTGGIKGAHIVLTDVASGLWHVSYVSDAGGTEATPFS